MKKVIFSVLMFAGLGIYSQSSQETKQTILATPIVTNQSGPLEKIS